MSFGYPENHIFQKYLQPNPSWGDESVNRPITTHSFNGIKNCFNLIWLSSLPRTTTDYQHFSINMWTSFPTRANTHKIFITNRTQHRFLSARNWIGSKDDKVEWCENILFPISSTIKCLANSDYQISIATISIPN